MFKKYTAIFFLSVSYAILLGHSIIPHHHHEHDPDKTAHHHSHEHHHNGESNSNDLSNLYAQLLHDADGFTFTAAHSITNIFSKESISFVALLPDNFSFDEFINTYRHDKPPAENLIFISTYVHLYGLRAPPASKI